MPHKRNPIGCEQIVGLARLLRGNAHAALENIALWHERDISHSSVERVILPDSFIALDHMLRRFTRIVRGHGRAPRSDAREPRTLARRGVLRDGAARAGAARASRASRPTNGCSATRCARSPSRRDFKALLLADPDVTARAAAGRDRARFDLDDQLKHVDDIFERVFQRLREGYRSHARARFRHAEAVGLRSAGPDHCRCAALARLRDVADVRQGKYFELDLATTEASASARAGRRSRRQGARQPGDRELSHRGRGLADAMPAVTVDVRPPGSSKESRPTARRCGAPPRRKRSRADPVGIVPPVVWNARSEGSRCDSGSSSFRAATATRMRFTPRRTSSARKRNTSGTRTPI